jgi:hypothetical protein
MTAITTPFVASTNATTNDSSTKQCRSHVLLIRLPSVLFDTVMMHIFLDDLPNLSLCCSSLHAAIQLYIINAHRLVCAPPRSSSTLQLPEGLPLVLKYAQSLRSLDVSSVFSDPCQVTLLHYAIPCV